MTQTECLTLRRKARRSGRLRPNACLLLAEICDFHGSKKGCIAKNTALAERLNCTTRSIREWLRELKSEGLVTEGSEGDQRVLCPRVPAWMEWNTSSSEERTFRQARQRSGTDIPERNEDSKRPGTNVPTQRDDNPEGTREGAPAHEETPVRDSDHPAVQAFVREVGRRPHGREQVEIPQVVGRTERRLAVFRRQCRKAVRNAGDPDRVRWGYLADDFEQAMKRKDQQGGPGGDGAAGGDGDPYSLDNLPTPDEVVAEIENG